MDVRLTDEELDDPFLALDRIFSECSLPGILIELKAMERRQFKRLFFASGSGDLSINAIRNFYNLLQVIIQEAYLLYDKHFDTAGEKS